MNDIKFMHEAFHCAILSVGKTDPNPAVGAVVVNKKKK